MTNYERAWEIMWARHGRPTGAHPGNCDMCENGMGDLGPCRDCLHCHYDADEIEAALDRGKDVKP